VTATATATITATITATETGTITEITETVIMQPDIWMNAESRHSEGWMSYGALAMTRTKGPRTTTP
jgi:hypothetical protein